MRRSANSAKASSTISSPKPKAPSRTWIRACIAPITSQYLLICATSLIAFCSESRDLTQLSTLGHFLKGSSATLGLTKVKDSCEKLQHYGARKDETGTTDEPDDDVSLQRCKRTIQEAKDQFYLVKESLKRFYRDEDA